MEPNENNSFQEVVGDSSSSVNGTLKRPSKSRSRVWEKVVWFTRKAKGGKDSKSAGASAAELLKSSTNSNLDLVRDPRELEVEKTSSKHKIRKNRSIKYLKRRKERQFGDDLSPEVVEKKVTVQECGTATGTFHDFNCERRMSRLHRTSSNNSLLNEIAKEMNRSPLKAKENVKSVLSLPLHDLSLNEGRIPDNITAPTFPPVRRSVSFSGPAYNSWPRKKRSHLENSSNAHLLSPPLKQKRVTSIKKRASFSGFDSSRVQQNSSLPQYRGVRSTPHLTHLEHGGHIRNQNGLTIGAIHFYKSPVLYQEEAALKILQPKMQEKLTCDNSFSKCTSPCSLTVKSDLENDRAITVSLTRGSDIITQHHDTAAIPNHEMLRKNEDENKLVHDELISSTQVANCSNNFLSFAVRSSESQNSTISAFLLEGECSSTCMTSSPVDSSDEDSEKEKLSLPSDSSEYMTQVDSVNEDVDAVKYNYGDFTSEDGIVHENVFASIDNNKARDNQDHHARVHKLEAVRQHSVSSIINGDSSFPAVVSDVKSIDTRTENEICATAHCDAQKGTALASQKLSLMDEIRRGEVRTSSPGHYGHGQSLWSGNQMIWQRKPTVDGTQFKKHSEVTPFEFHLFFALRKVWPIEFCGCLI